MNSEKFKLTNKNMYMKKMLCRELIRSFLATAFVVASLLTVSAQRFETQKVYLSDNVGLTRTIKIKPAVKFSIKKDNRYSWAKYEEQNDAIIISVTTNTSKNSRSCTLVLLDEAKTPVDTLEVMQAGKSSTVVSKVASSKRSSSGGLCAARTKKGIRCSRKATTGSIYCWQHNK